MKVEINKIEFPLKGRTISIKGHLDDDNVFRVYEECLVTHPELSYQEVSQVKDILSHEPNIIIA